MANASDTVTVAPGATIEFDDAAGIKVNAGAFSAIGEEGNVITFTGAVETAGFWEAIVFNSNNPANELAFTDIGFGGKGDSFGFSGNIEALIIATDNGQATVRDSNLHDSPDLCTDGANLVTMNLTTSNCN
jgi:hypothetical protein